MRQPIRDLPLARREDAANAIPVMGTSTQKDGNARFCVDDRMLNAVTKKDSYPLPRVDTSLQSFYGSMWFSTLDLKSGYWKVEMDEEDIEKTAFTTDQGLWQLLVMPIALKQRPGNF